MEHLKTEILFDRMDEILGYPTTDPHGSPIPDKDGKIHRHKYDLLSAIEVGKTVKLMAVADSSISLLHLLNEKEIKLGTSFSIVKKEKFDGTMVVNYDGHDGVTLSHEVCKRLKVESVEA